MIQAGADVDFSGLKPDVANGLHLMSAEYTAATGEPLRVNSAFRSWEKQSRLHAENPDRAAAPGRSMHNYGYAFDVDSSQADTLARLGLLAKYRFARPVRGEPWHIERAGLVYAAVRAAGLVGAVVAAVGLAWLLSK